MQNSSTVSSNFVIGIFTFCSKCDMFHFFSNASEMRRPLYATTRSTGSQYVNLENRYEHQKCYLPQVKSNPCCLHLDNDGVWLYVPLQWFNLNSLLTGPELISDTYLALFLAQLQQEGNNQNSAPLFFYQCVDT